MRRFGHPRLARLGRGLATTLLVLSLTAMGTIGPADPAGAANGDLFTVRDPYGLCLDSNGDGDVYALPCARDSYNRYQVWQEWFGGFSKNHQTLMCLTLMPGWDVKTQQCDPGNRYQHWQQWNGGWLRNPYDRVCVTVGYWFPPRPADVSATECGPSLLQQFVHRPAPDR